MKSFILYVALALILGVNVHGADHVDDNWLSGSYGAPGDSVIKEVKTQIADYAVSKAHAYKVQQGDIEGDLAAAQEDCIKYALYSYVKAMYAAEKGRVAASNGETVLAIKEYKRALKFAIKAKSVNHKDVGLGKTSKEIGVDFENKSLDALKKLE